MDTDIRTCPNCGSSDVRRFTRVARAAWALLAGGLVFAPFTAGLSLALPVAAVLLREPWWECEACWHHGPVASNRTARFAWSHHARH